MINLKRNSKLELVEATGVTSQKWRMYQPNQNKDFTVSRSRFDSYMTCHRCFYLKTNRGLMEPSTPGWTLNTLTDTLLKKDFDAVRGQVPHPLMVAAGVSHLRPFWLEDMGK